MNNVMNNWFKSVSGFFSIIVIATAMTGCGPEKKESNSQEAIPVKVLTASKSSIENHHQFPGQVKSDKEAKLSSIVMGTITHSPVDIGDKVKKGDLLIRIKDDQILAQKSQLEARKVQAKANLENTEKNYQRIKNLYAEESATSKELDDISTMYEIAKANMEALEARLNEVNEMLAYTSIRAPFDGIVARKFVSEGDMAAPGHPLVAIADPATIKITANVPEKWINTIKQNSKVLVTIDAAGLQQVPAILTAVSEAGDPMSRQFSIEAKLVNVSDTETLKPGMFSQISIKLDGDNALYIPKNALVKRGQLTGVYTFNENQVAMLQWIRTGQSMADSVEVLSGLKEGEQFVVESPSSLRQGQQLTIQ